jgi:hypothetical protein
MDGGMFHGLKPNARRNVVKGLAVVITSPCERGRGAPGIIGLGRGLDFRVGAKVRRAIERSLPHLLDPLLNLQQVRPVGIA